MLRHQKHVSHFKGVVKCLRIQCEIVGAKFSMGKEIDTVFIPYRPAPVAFKAISTRIERRFFGTFLSGERKCVFIMLIWCISDFQT